MSDQRSWPQAVVDLENNLKVLEDRIIVVKSRRYDKNTATTALCVLFVSVIINGLYAVRTLSAAKPETSENVTSIQINDVINNGSWSGLVVAGIIFFSQLFIFYRAVIRSSSKTGIQRQLDKIQSQAVELSRQISTDTDEIEIAQRQLGYRASRLAGLFTCDYETRKQTMLAAIGEVGAKKEMDKIITFLRHKGDELGTDLEMLQSQRIVDDFLPATIEAFTQLKQIMLTDPAAEFFALFNEKIHRAFVHFTQLIAENDEQQSSEILPDEIKSAVDEAIRRIKSELMEWVSQQQKIFYCVSGQLKADPFFSQAADVEVESEANVEQFSKSIAGFSVLFGDNLKVLIDEAAEISHKKLIFQLESANSFRLNQHRSLSEFTDWTEDHFFEFQIEQPVERTIMSP